MRIRSVLKLHTANRRVVFGMPFMAMGLAFAFIIAIGLFVHVNASAEVARNMFEGMAWNGAVFSYLGPLMGFGFMAMGQYFSLASGMGITRREFVAGTSLMFLLNSVLFAGVTTIGKVVEVLTGGWWLGVRFFDVVYTGTGPAWMTFVQTFCLITMLMFVGAAVMTAFLRWGQLFLVLFIALLVLAVLAVTAIALLHQGFASQLWRVGQMGWLPWMGVFFAVALAGAGSWTALVRRAQAR